MRKDANIILYQSDPGQHLVYGSFQTPVYRTSFGKRTTALHAEQVRQHLTSLDYPLYATGSKNPVELA